MNYERGTQCCAFGCTKRWKKGARSDSEGSNGEKSVKAVSKDFFLVSQIDINKNAEGSPSAVAGFQQALCLNTKYSNKFCKTELQFLLKSKMEYTYLKII